MGSRLGWWAWQGQGQRDRIGAPGCGVHPAGPDLGTWVNKQLPGSQTRHQPRCRPSEFAARRLEAEAESAFPQPTEPAGQPRRTGLPQPPQPQEAQGLVAPAPQAPGIARQGVPSRRSAPTPAPSETCFGLLCAQTSIWDGHPIPGSPPGQPAGASPSIPAPHRGDSSELQELSLESEALEVEELSAEIWTGVKVILPALFTEVGMPDMPMPLLQGLGASAKLATLRLAVGSPAEAAASQLLAWNREGEVMAVAGVSSSCWEPQRLEGILGSSCREEPRDSRKMAVPRRSPPTPETYPRILARDSTPSRRPITCLTRQGAGRGETDIHPPGLHLCSDLRHDTQLRARPARS